MLSIVVLLVDDEIPFVETLSKRIGKRGVSVKGVHSGLEALEELSRNHTIDVVILDVKMPGMDGIETLKEIKHNFPLVEVIMLTGHATVQSAIDGMKLGAFDYLMKPCEIDLLIAKVDEAKTKKSNHEQKILEAKAKSIADRRGD
ncbi:response regulator [Acidobacteriota bacterium]